MDFNHTHHSREGLEQKNLKKKGLNHVGSRSSGQAKSYNTLQVPSQDSGLRLHDGLSPRGPVGPRRVLRAISEGQGRVQVAMSSQRTGEIHTTPNSL